MSTVEVRRECRKFAQKFVDIQRQDFMRLGVFGEWDKPYLTMGFEYEARIAEAFLAFLAAAMFIAGARRFTGAFPAKRRWRKRKWNMRTIAARRSMCVTR